MIELIGVHRMDHAHLIGDVVKMRNRIRHPHPRLTRANPFAGRTHQFGDAGRKSEFASFQKLVGAILAVAFVQFWFVIEQIEVRWRASHMKIDDSLRFRREMRRLRCERVIRRPSRRRFATEQRSKRHATDTGCRLPQKVSSSALLERCESEIHNETKGF